MNVSLIHRTDRPNSTKECPLALCYSHDNKKVLFGLSRSVKKEHWNAGSTDTWIKASYGDNTTFNLVLKKAKADAEDIANRFYLDQGRYPSATEFKSLYNRVDKTRSGIMAYWDDFMRYQQTGRGHHNISPGHAVGYGYMKKHLDEFEAAGNKLTFAGINTLIAGKLTAFLKAKGYGVNTIAGKMALLRSFLHWCESSMDFKIPASAFQELAFKHKKVEKQWLTQHERARVNRIDLNKMLADALAARPTHSASIKTKFIMLEKCRDILNFLYETGFRISDLMAVTDNTFSPIPGGGYSMKFRTVKNDAPIEWPFVPDMLIPLIEKYKGVSYRQWIPWTFEVNTGIKELCRLAGIDNPIEIYGDTKGVGRVVKIVPKWQTISCHSLRRSFINNLRQLGFDPGKIASLTGQATPTVYGYFHTNNENMAEGIMKMNQAAHAAGAAAEPNGR